MAQSLRTHAKPATGIAPDDQTHLSMMLNFFLPLLATAGFTYAAERLVAQNFPNYIIPVNSATPGIAYGTQYSGQVVSPHDLHF
jgi:hypothetical protein